MPLVLILLLLSIAVQAQPTPGPTSGTATLVPLASSGVTGTVIAQATAAGTRVLARIDGLAPGNYGFHLVRASCEALDGVPTFDTRDRPHGGPYAPPELRRVGDLGNVRIRHRDPVGRYDRIIPDLPFEQAQGLAVVVREGLDDLHTQPLGGAGEAVACGTIEID